MASNIRSHLTPSLSFTTKLHVKVLLIIFTADDCNHVTKIISVQSHSYSNHFISKISTRADICQS